MIMSHYHLTVRIAVFRTDNPGSIPGSDITGRWPWGKRP